MVAPTIYPACFSPPFVGRGWGWVLYPFVVKNDDAPINYGGRGENIKGQNPNDVNTPGRGLRQHSEGMSEMSEANERFPS